MNWVIVTVPIRLKQLFAEELDRSALISFSGNDASAVITVQGPIYLVRHTKYSICRGGNLIHKCFPRCVHMRSI